MSEDGTTTTEPSTRLDRRSDRHPIRWVLLVGSRQSVTLLFSVIILVALLTVGTLWELEMETLVDETRAVQSLFNTLLGGIILFVSVVLSINTGILSQEFAPPWVKQTQIEESMEFRAQLEEFVGSEVSPVELKGFLLFVVRALRTECERLRNAAETSDEADLRRDLAAFVDDVDEEATLVESRLRSRPRDFAAILLAGLDYDIALDLYTARRLEVEYGDAIGEEGRESLATMIEILKALASGHEYYTTLYYKREVRNLSSMLLVLALPVIVFTSYVLLAIDAGLFPTMTVLGIQPRLLYVSLAFVVTLSPYVLLSAYMLRIVTVSQYSLGSSGFTSQREQ